MDDRERDEMNHLRLTVAARASDADLGSSALRRMVAELVLETTNEGIWLIDAQARTTFVNRAAAELLGYAEEEMIGRHIFDFMDEERRPIAQQNLMARQRGVEDRQEVKLRRKDGTYVWVIGSANPVYDREGRYAGALALMGDLTRQKQTEDGLRAQVDELSAKLREPLTPPRAPAEPPPVEPPPQGFTERPSLFGQALRTATAMAAAGTFLGVAGTLAIAAVVCVVLGESPPVMPQDC